MQLACDAYFVSTLKQQSLDSQRVSVDRRTMFLLRTHTAGTAHKRAPSLARRSIARLSRSLLSLTLIRSYSARSIARRARMRSVCALWTLKKLQTLSICFAL